MFNFFTNIVRWTFVGGVLVARVEGAFQAIFFRADDAGVDL